MGGMRVFTITGINQEQEADNASIINYRNMKI